MKTKNLFKLGVLALMVSMPLVKSQAQNNKKPNVIWIITDEHNFRTIGAYRAQLTPEQALLWGPKGFPETPHLDNLAKN